VFLRFCLDFYFKETDCVDPFFFQHPFEIRIRRLYDKMGIPRPTKKDIKTQAKLAKGFMVLLKKKLNRDILPRSVPFRRLMALVFDPDGKDGCFKNRK